MEVLCIPPKIKLTTNRTTKIKKMILAISIAPDAMPPKPKKAAIRARIRNERVQRNMR